MKRTIAFLSSIVLMIIISSPSAIAYDYSDNINEGISAFFLTNLDVGETIEINITHSGSGNFTLFLFDKRPDNSYVNFDKTLNKEIFNLAINYSLEENPYLYFNATASKIYYFQLILLEDGPSTYFLYSSKELTRYYLPIISGYQILPTIILIGIALSLLSLIYKKKIYYH